MCQFHVQSHICQILVFPAARNMLNYKVSSFELQSSILWSFWNGNQCGDNVEIGPITNELFQVLMKQSDAGFVTPDDA